MSGKSPVLKAWAVERRWKYFASDDLSAWHVIPWTISDNESGARKAFLEEFSDEMFSSGRARLVRVIVTKEIAKK